MLLVAGCLKVNMFHSAGMNAMTLLQFLNTCEAQAVVAQ